MRYNLGNLVLKIGAALFCYRLGQTLLKLGSFIIPIWSRCCYKFGQLLQIKAPIVRKYGSYYNLGQDVLQIRSGITN